MGMDSRLASSLTVYQVAAWDAHNCRRSSSLCSVGLFGPVVTSCHAPVNREMSPSQSQA